MPAPDTTSERLLQACREWFKTAGARGGLTDSQVIPADDKGPRPPMPYLTIKIVASDVETAVDEELPASADTFEVGTDVAGTTYALTVNGDVIAYIRLLGDSDADVAEALAAAIRDGDNDAYAEADGDLVIVSAITGTLTTSESDPNLVRTAADVPVMGIGGQRTGTVSVQGFGPETAAWLERATIRLAGPEIRAQLDAAGLSVRPSGGMTDVSQLIDTSIEHRYLREYTLDYARRAEPETQIEAENAATTFTLESFDGDPTPLVIPIDTPVTE